MIQIIIYIYRLLEFYQHHPLAPESVDSTSIFRHFLLLFTTYLATITSNSLLTDTIGIVNNGSILTDDRDERKYLENKYNEL